MNNKPNITLSPAEHNQAPHAAARLHRVAKYDYPRDAIAREQVEQGHSSTKTTEIYTHVSQNDFNKFKKPIDDISLEDDS